MRAFRSIAVLLVLGLSTHTTLAETVTVDTARGPAEVPKLPEKVAVFDISALDSIAALGVSVDGSPQRLYVDYLDKAAEKAAPIGSLFEPDFEAVNALGPDLIVAGGRSSRQYDSLSEFAPAIDMTIWGDGLLDQANSRLRAYGKIFGRDAKAEELVANLNQKVAELNEKTKDAGTALILLTNGPKISVYGKGSRFGWLHTELGWTPAIDEVKASTHGEVISFEFIRETNPDWLIVVDRAAAIGQDAALAAETLDNKLVAETTAWKSGQVIYLDAAKVYIAAGGYQSLMGTMTALSDALSHAN